MKDETLFGIFIVLAIIFIFTLGHAAGGYDFRNRIINSNKTCWETHAVLVDGGKGDFYFRCYEVNKDEQ